MAPKEAPTLAPIMVAEDMEDGEADDMGDIVETGKEGDVETGLGDGISEDFTLDSVMLVLTTDVAMLVLDVDVAIEVLEVEEVDTPTVVKADTFPEGN